jgi:hypothetical protein
VAGAVIPEPVSYPIDVHYLDTVTGERAVVREQGHDDEGIFSDFWWSDGNGACDCNRAGEMARARGEAPPPTSCVGTRYRIERIVRVSDGVEIYTESA